MITMVGTRELSLREHRLTIAMTSGYAEETVCAGIGLAKGADSIVHKCRIGNRPYDRVIGNGLGTRYIPW